MTVTTIADVGGSTITLIVNGARLTMDLHTAQQICDHLAHQLDQLALDQAAALVQRKLEEEYYRGSHH
jgi:hypothetical protein